LKNLLVELTKKRGRGEKANPLILKKQIIGAMVEVGAAEQMTQTKLMEMVGMTQMTAVRYVSELKGEGVLWEYRFGTSTIYSITSLDTLIERGYVIDVFREEEGPYAIGIGRLDEKFIIEVRGPPTVNLIFAVNGDKLLGGLNELEGIISKASKVVRNAKKKVRKEMVGGT
jgi:predicted transcriptional regulator